MKKFATSSSTRPRISIHWEWLLWLVLLVPIGVGLWWHRGRAEQEREAAAPSPATQVAQELEPLYQRAVEAYSRGDFAAAISTLEQAEKLSPNVVRVDVLLGWSHWRLGDAEAAEPYFARAYAMDNTVEQAQLGLAFASLALDRVDTAIPLLQNLAVQHPDDPDILLALARCYSKKGQTSEAAATLRSLLAQVPTNEAAQQELLALTGQSEFRPEMLTVSPSSQRPSQLQMHFRTRGNYLQMQTGNEWKNIYIAGVNIGPARPGEFPSTAAREFSVYQTWFREIAAMNANTIRVYTVLPPAFYQALKTHNESSASPLWLIQEIWVPDDAEDLYDPKLDREFREEIRNVIDLLHGQASIAYRPGRHYGLYSADVSRYVLGLAVGRELEPTLVLRTNHQNPSFTSYRGRFISLPQGNPSEAWLARMCDFAINYEIEKYNWQHPIAVVTWPPLDPITHPTESTYAEELQIRKNLGEMVSDVLPEHFYPNDGDVVSIDITKFQAESSFAAGVFAMHHIYQHWPDFMLHEPSYAQARDAQGPNRYLGYLRELKKVHPHFPLLVGEYGVSTSLGVAHSHPQGWHNGGLTEQQQAELLVRFTQNIRDTGYAGGLVFEWQDEWFKHVHDNNTGDFSLPWERNPLWLNLLDPEQNFGLVGFQPNAPVPLLRGQRSDWQGAVQLYTGEGSLPDTSVSPGDIRALYAMADFAYLYLRLDVEPGRLDWNRLNYWIALNTLPGQSGSRQLPDIGVAVESGVNFLIQLTGAPSSRILIAENYDPRERVTFPGTQLATHLRRKRGMQLRLEQSSPFQEMLTEVNLRRFARDGTVFPAVDFNRSPLRYGTADPNLPQFSTHATWHADERQGLIELRIPWGLLLVMDPSGLQVFAGTDADRYTSSPGSWFPKFQPTPGISIAAFALRTSSPGGGQSTRSITSSLPSLREGLLSASPAVYTWKSWEKVAYRPYFKPSYFALQEIFGKISDHPPNAPVERSAVSLTER